MRGGVETTKLARCLSGELVYEPDIAKSTSPLHARLAQVGMRSLVSVPLIAESKVSGAMICT